MAQRTEFETFLRMILKGRNDLTYRSYDLDEIGKKSERIWAYQFAGLIRPAPGNNDVDCNMAALKLQRDLLSQGFPVVPVDRLDELIKQFWPYYRLSHNLRKGPRRPPEVVTRMYNENMEAERKEHANR